MKSFGELVGFKQRLETAAQQREESLRLARERAAKAKKEAELFRREMADAVPIAAHNRRAPDQPNAKPYPFQTERDEQAALLATMSDEIDIERLLDTDANLSYHRPEMGQDVVRKLRRGHWSVKAQLDLHGLRTEEARAALVGFINQCQKQDWRCVRIIHGKGLGSPDKSPVLKDKVLRWLVQKDEVLAFCQARPNDGGSGALVVLLKAS